MTYITVGNPSMSIHLGRQTCVGERWVAPGVGSRMLDYLRRTYGGRAPKVKRQHTNYNHWIAHALPAAVRERKEPVRTEGGKEITRACAWPPCGKVFTQYIPPTGGAGRKYCSDKCAGAAHAEQARKSRMR